MKLCQKLMVQLIGELRELLLQLKIKVHVDLVGLSQLQELLKDIGKLIKVHYQAYLNNN